MSKKKPPAAPAFPPAVDNPEAAARFNVRLRPKGGATADMWHYFDTRPTPEQRAAHAAKLGWNQSTINIQFRAWHVAAFGEPPPVTRVRHRKTDEERAAEKAARVAALEARAKGSKRRAAALEPEQTPEVPPPAAQAPVVPAKAAPAFKVRVYPRACSCGGFEHLPSKRCFYCGGSIGGLIDDSRGDRPAVEYVAHRVASHGPFAVGPTIEVAVQMLGADDRPWPGLKPGAARTYEVHALSAPSERITLKGTHSADAPAVAYGSLD